MITLTKKESDYILLDTEDDSPYFVPELLDYIEKVNKKGEKGLEMCPSIFISPENNPQGQGSRFPIDQDLLDEKVERRLDQWIERESKK